ncbi:hypothetical protein BDY21DRAFT_77046 [Lineolata rhizophorae]|uniref:Uncharacterized protein n=1 Tax=Lineolata rhizophorae TaxID=578093 RepID=A0A6A6NTE5_9PEZI|nr:hypothetical protein BDY21DRAFT_77046 [Lineolata rhizophorae]
MTSSVPAGTQQTSSPAALPVDPPRPHPAGRAKPPNPLVSPYCAAPAVLQNFSPRSGHIVRARDWDLGFLGRHVTKLGGRHKPVVAGQKNQEERKEQKSGNSFNMLNAEKRWKRKGINWRSRLPDWNSDPLRTNQTRVGASCFKLIWLPIGGSGRAAQALSMAIYSHASGIGHGNVLAAVFRNTPVDRKNAGAWSILSLTCRSGAPPWFCSPVDGS